MGRDVKVENLKVDTGFGHEGRQKWSINSNGHKRHLGRQNFWLGRLRSKITFLGKPNLALKALACGSKCPIHFLST